MLEESRKQELNQYVVKEQNPADFFNEQINWQNGFDIGTYWATRYNGKGHNRYTYADKSGGWKFHIHADNDEDWQKISSVLLPYLKDVDALFKTYTAPDANAYSQRPRELFYNKDENQYGKAFTIYPETIEEFEKLAQEMNYILENNNLNNHQGFIHGDNQIGDHGRIFYRNEWAGPDNPSYRANADNELPSYKAEGIEDPFLNVLGYPNDNTNADKAAGTHGPRKLVENRLAKLKEAEERIAREQAEREALKQQQAEKEVVEEVELKAVEVPVVEAQNEEIPVKEAQTERAKVVEVKKQPTLNEAIKFASNKKAKKNATLEDIVANYEVLKQKDTPEGERRTVKKEMEQLQSLAQTKMDEAIIHIAKLKKNNDAPSAEEVTRLNNLLASFDDKEVGAYLPSIRKLRSQLEEFQPAKDEVVELDSVNQEQDDYEEIWDESDDYASDYYEYDQGDVDWEWEAWKEQVDEWEEVAEKRRREEAFLPSDGNGKHYSKKDLETILSTFNGILERNDGNGTSFESLFEYGMQDLRDYNEGKLTLDPDAGEVMKEFINIFATDSKGNLNEVGQKALENVGNKANMLWRYQRVQDIDFVHHCSGHPVFHSKEEAEQFHKEAFREACLYRYSFKDEQEFEDKFKEVYAIHWESLNKPLYGLYTSANTDANVSEWKKFVLGERADGAWLGLERFNVHDDHWHIVPNDDCRILSVAADVSNLKEYVKPGYFKSSGYVLDYDKVSEDYDAIYVPREAQEFFGRYVDEEKTKLFMGFPGWNVSTCVFLKEKFQVMNDEEYKEYRLNKLYGKTETEKVVENKEPVAEVVEPEVGTAIPVVEAKVAELEVDIAIPVVEAKVAEPEVGTAIPVVEAKVAEPEVDTAIPVVEAKVVEPEVVDVSKTEDIDVIEIPEFRPQQKPKIAATTLADRLKAQGIDLSSPEFKVVKKEITPKKTRWQKIKERVKNIFVPIPAYKVVERGKFANGDAYSRSFTVPEKKSLISRMGNKLKLAAIGIATVAAVAFGLNKCSDNKQKVEPKEKAKTEVKTQPRKVIVPSEQNKVIAVRAGDIEKAYYDSAIEMQIGAKKRDVLYGVIEKRVNKNELDIGAFSVERAAHAMVMYQKIQPNNEINKVFNKVVKGEKLTQVDNARIKKSVQDAGEYGDGVKGKGNHNQFEKVSKQQQVKHVKAVKAMHER